MVNKRIKSLVLAMILVMSVAFANSSVIFAQTNNELVIVHINDTHARVRSSMDNDGNLTGVGFDRITTYRNELLRSNPNVLLLDAGDTIHGQPIATLSQGESIVRLLNLMEIDAFVPGNHDFNYGFDRLKELERMMNFPVIAANVTDTSGNLVFEPYIIKEMEGFKVGIFGLATPETAWKTNPANVESVRFTDIVEGARKSVEALKAEGVDVIIALSHLGLYEGDYTSDIVINAVDGIDVLVDGHSHTTLEEGLMINDTLVVSRGEYDKAFGVVTLKLQDGKVTEKTARLIKAADSIDIEPDSAVLSLLTEIEGDVQEILSTVIGSTAVELDGARENVRTGESNLGQLLTDSMKAASGAEIAITNGGGIRASIPAGEITKNHIVTAFPFGNYLVTKNIKGSDIVAALEVGSAGYPDQLGAFSHVSGLTYNIAPNMPAGSRVTDVMVGSSPIDMDREYLVVTNDFMAAGGDGYVMFKDQPVVNEFDSLDEVLIYYIQSLGQVQGTMTPRITFNDVEATQPEVEEPVVTPAPTLPSRPYVAPSTVNYVVAEDSTIFEIANQLGQPWQYIIVLNPETVSTMSEIKAGQVLKVPSN